MSKVILAIETSCDETAMALVEASGGLRAPKFKILADAVSSQIPIHRPFGGVVPNLAKREHLKNLPIVYKKILQKFKIRNLKLKIDCVAVTVGPGLEPALWTGLNFAKNLAKELKVPLVGVNHLEGHIYSNWLGRLPSKYSEGNLPNIEFLAIVLLVSGGHTILLLMKSMRRWKVLGETRDDAVGEAFDKVARMLGLPYPGGPEVESLSDGFKSLKFKKLINFPRPMIHDKNYDFSFSGLKTAVLYYIRDLISSHSKSFEFPHGKLREESLKKDSSFALLSQNDKMKICASFQAAAIDVLVSKTLRAAQEFKAKSILLCGGVACNKALQKSLLSGIKDRGLKVKFHVPNMKFNTDNAVMIAAAAYVNYLQKKGKYKLTAQGNLGV